MTTEDASLDPTVGGTTTPPPAVETTEPASSTDPRSDGPREAVAALIRQTVEFLVILCLGILIFRTFAAEAYIVPTGSMAPTLLGSHREYDCVNCGATYVLGVDEHGRAGRPVCPNCGQPAADPGAGQASSGDRLLVQKYLFDFRSPRRWEVAVFQSPAEPEQAYVKRVVGLPGEAIEVRGGDLYIDGKIARKGLADLRAMRQLVYDNNFVPADAERFPRWTFHRGRSRRAASSGWKADGCGFVHVASPGDGDTVDWIDYRHWDPDTGRYGPIRDFAAYNGGDLRGDNVVSDLAVDFKVSTRPDVRALVVLLHAGGDAVYLKLPIDGRGEPEVRRNGKLMDVVHPRRSIASSPAGAEVSTRLEVSVVDRRLLVAIDRDLAFDPIDWEAPSPGVGRFATPVSIGVEGGGIAIDELKIYRDVHYTGTLANTPRRLFGVGEPYILGRDEFFVLGDNSPVSNDSRFWEASPVVRRRDFLGKPFLVHLPGQLATLKVFGRSICWIPDPREIRYIR